MNKLTALILALALALSIAFPASAYYADVYGSREDVPTVPQTFVELVAETITQRMDKPDGEEELTFEEKAAINHDEDDHRWFDLPECQHLESTVWPCWSPDDGDFYEDICDVCGLVLAEWPMVCQHDNTVEYELHENRGVFISVVCSDCGAEVDGWEIPESDPDDYPEEDEEITNEEAWIPEEVSDDDL